MSLARSDMQRPLLAGALIVLAMAILSLADNTIYVLAPEIGLWQFHLLRSALACAMLLAVARGTGWRLVPDRWWAWGLRSFFAAMSMLFYFGALSLMTMAQAGAGLFTSPVFVMVLSVAVFGLRIGRRRLAALALGFGGTLLMLRPWDAEGVTPFAAALAVAGGFFYALAALATRQWCANEPTAAMNMGYFGFMGVLGALGLAVLTMIRPDASAGAEGFLLRGWAAPSARAWFWITVQAVFSLLAIGLLIRGYQMAEASQVAIFEYAFLPFAVLWSFLLFAGVPDFWTYCGMGMIILAGALIARAAASVDAPPDDSRR